MSNPTSEYYADLARSLAALRNCERSHNGAWFDRWSDRIDALCEALPSGSGVDGGTSFDLARSTPEKLVFTLSYHHMNEGGYYDGWTSHTVTVRPSFVFGVDVTISGRNRNDIKEYLAQLFTSTMIPPAVLAADARAIEESRKAADHVS
jgi:hypothetical protein